MPQATEAFQDQLVDQLRRAPWLITSIVFHGAILLLVWDLEFSRRPHVEEKTIQADLVTRIEEELQDLEMKIEEVEIESPETEFTDVNTPPSPEPPDPPKGDPEPGNDERKNDPFAGSVIGLGPGPNNPFGNRLGTGQPPGTPRDAYRAVLLGLDWLRKHQNPDGSWDADGFDAQCDGPTCTGRGNPLHDPGVTGLALLAFLGAGYNHLDGSPNGAAVKAGLRYLKRIQDPEGFFGSRLSESSVYDHAICTLAATEAYGLTGSTPVKPMAQRGIEWIERARNPYGAWRYGERSGESDTSVTGWMVMALKSAKLSGLEVDPAAFRGARDFLDRVTDESGAVGYTRRGTGTVRLPHKIEEFPARYSRSLTAVGVLSRVFLGEDPARSSPVQRGADLVVTALPEWDAPRIDMYYWYYGTLAMYQVGGDRWKKWNRAMKSAVLESQEKKGCESGSWDPVGAWGEEGGRVYSTALMTMCLEVYYRYGRVFGGGRK